MRTNRFFIPILATLLGAATFSCQNMVRPDFDFVSGDDPALNGPLQRLFAFEDSPVDSVLGGRGTATGISYVDGVRGKAYQGSKTGQIEYATAGKLATMESFTFAFWMKLDERDGGAQSVFMLPRTDDFWGNTFMMVDGAAKGDSMLVKFHFAGNWVTFDGNGSKANGLNRWPDAYGKWKHVAFTYDAATSKFATYLDGSKLPLAASVTDRIKPKKDKDDPAVPLGALQFKNPSKFLFGAFQQQVGTNGEPAEWMKHYQGALDQFRVYTNALTESEVKELYTSKK